MDKYIEEQIRDHVLNEAANGRTVPTACRIEPGNFLSMIKRLGAMVTYDDCTAGSAPQLSLLLYVGGNIRVRVCSDPTIAGDEVTWANAEKAPTTVYDVKMVRGLARAASLLESLNGGQVWDDESRTALELARKVGIAPSPSPKVERQVYEPAAPTTND